MSPTVIPLIALLVVLPLGAFDSSYFHQYKFRLFSHPSAWAETTTHVIRALLIGSFALLIANYEPHGTWFWVGVGLVAADTVNNVIDVILEPEARKEHGGLPPAEYVIHIIGATMVGVIGASFLALGWFMGALPTALAATGNPAWLQIAGSIAGTGAILGGVMEGAMMCNAMRAHYASDRDIEAARAA